MKIISQLVTIKCVDSGIKQETEISIDKLLSLAVIHLNVRADTVEKTPIVRELQWEIIGNSHAKRFRIVHDSVEF